MPSAHPGRLVPVVLLGCLLGAGCGSLPTPPPAPSPTVTTSPRPASVKPPTEGELRSALLTADDLPGFTVQSTSAGGSSAGPSGEFQGCPALTEETTTAGVPSVSVSVQLSQGVTGPFVSEAVTASSVEQARQTVAGVAQVFDECRQFTAQANGTTMTSTTGTLDMPPLGDETAAFRMTTTSPTLPIPLRAEVVLIRHRAVTIQIMHISISTVDTAVTRSAAQQAWRKVEQLG
ncbi:MAG: hypothetical protein ABW046_05530 [Actinoplanes sp.]